MFKIDESAYEWQKRIWWRFMAFLKVALNTPEKSQKLIGTYEVVSIVILNHAEKMHVISEFMDSGSGFHGFLVAELAV